MATTSLQNISEATALNDRSQEENGREKSCRIWRQVRLGYVSTMSGKALWLTPIYYNYFCLLKVNIRFQIFIALVANTGIISTGCSIAMTGLIIAKLKEPSSLIKITSEQESWFGKLFILLILSLLF